MKICTITCHDVYNFGASLQAYALMSYLQSLGHVVEIIDYKPDYLSRHYSLFGVSNPKYRKNLFSRLVYNVLKFPKRLWLLKNKWIFDRYQKTHLVRTKKRYRTNDEIKRDVPVADAYICGSDQVWNPLMKNGQDKAFYLDFVPKDKKKISYAASMAVDEIPTQYKDFICQQISSFNFISVRETTAVRLLSEMGITSIQVVDPVFLLEKNFWAEQLKEKDVKFSKEKYILVYDFEKNPKVKEFVEDYALKNKLKIITVFKSDYATLNIAIKDPNDFLAAIKNAEFVVSNSFHATAFSIIFQKQFVVFNRKENVNTRMLDLLTMFGLSERLLTKDFAGDVVNYNDINEFMESAVAKSKSFLEEALNDIPCRQK